MGAEEHVVAEPEWMIDAQGSGGFRVECQCGWEASGFDTASRARTAAFEHSTSGASPASDRSPDEGRRRRFWQRK